LDFVDRNGHPLRAVPLDNNPFQQPVQYADIPLPLIQATLAAEDRRFWHHAGVDWRASLRAAGQFLLHRRVISGGSTITQQLIKLAQPRPRTLRTKVIEAVQALRLEQIWNKQQILATYLGRLDYGNFNRGCAAAARFYFAKPLRDLSPAECSLLAALPQAPSRLNPHAHFQRALKRQHWILARMHRAGWLADAEFARALAEQLALAAPRRTFEAPHFIDLVLADSGLPPHRHATAGAEIEKRSYDGRPADPIRTTLDLDLNRFAQETLRQHLAHLRAQHVSNGAIVILDNQTGDVLALVGSENYFSPGVGQVNGAWAARSAGSTLKPFTYLLAFERGATPATVVADVPAEFATATGLFAPVNYNRHCYGPMRYRFALANSLNISAVKVLASIGGPEPLQHFLQQCGLTTLQRPAEDYGLGLTIGDAEARLLELANAYACLARLGRYKPYRLLAPPSLTARSAGVQIASPGPAWLIADILSDNNARALAFGAESSLHFDFPVACKTGTSSDFRDNWAFGYTPEFTVGVWVGNFNGAPMRHVSGVTGAGPVLHALFEHLRERYGTTWYPTPANIVECAIHPLTGKRLLTMDRAPAAGLGQFNRSGDGSSPAFFAWRAQHGEEPAPLLLCSVLESTPPVGLVQEKFFADNLPPFETDADYAGGADDRLESISGPNASALSRSPRHGHTQPSRILPLPFPRGEGRGDGSRFVAYPTTPSISVDSEPFGQNTAPLRPPVRLGREYAEWLASSDNYLGSRVMLATGGESPRILFPPPGTRFYLDPDLPEQGRRVRVRATGPDDMVWRSDSLTFTREGSNCIALLTAGRHQLAVRDAATGVEAQTWILVQAR
jgi:penicillin-binding protein 1C